LRHLRCRVHDDFVLDLRSWRFEILSLTMA